MRSWEDRFGAVLLEVGPPWMTKAAASVVADLILPAGTIARLLDESGWNQVTPIAKATGRLRP